MTIFVVVGNPPEHALAPRMYRGNWSAAAAFAQTLQQAGFAPVVVPDRGEVPANAPFTERFTTGAADPYAQCPAWENQRFFTLISGGVIPTYGCLQFGYRFELHRSREAPAVPIDAHWTVDFIYGWLAAPLGWLEGYSVHVIHVPASAGYERIAPALRAALLEALEVPKPTAPATAQP